MAAMQSARPDSESRAATRPDAAPLRAVELLSIVVVWLFYGALTLATPLLEQRRERGSFEALSNTNPRFFINPILWAALTTLILWMSRRVSLDGAFWRRRGVLVVLAAVLVANGSDMVSDALWDAFASPSIVRRVRHEAEEHRFRPGLRNLTWLDDFAVIIATLAAATARGYVLRERARLEAARRREAELEAESAQARADAAHLEAQLAEAKLEALRRQLDPHFLFNTLNGVSALVERDPRGVRRMIGQLSDLLRHSMEGASSPEIPLRQELELLERYVDIMRVRFQDQLVIETRADPRTLDALVPNMILQPLVENAIKHGVEQREDGGRVEVETLLDGHALVLRVCDDGPGMPAWTSEAATGGSTSKQLGDRGVGLRNTAARLAQLYGDAHSFTIGPRADGGTLAEVRLPFHTRPEVRQHDLNGVAGDAPDDERTRAG